MNNPEPTSAAAFLADRPEPAEPRYDSWPPINWFVGPDEIGASGEPFDWSPPAPGFSVEVAYLWVTRAAKLYCYLDTVNSKVRNGPTSSALTNAYLLVSDLRSRGLVPLSGFKIYRVPMDDCTDGFEACQLGVVSDWLATALPQVPCQPTPRLTVNQKEGTVTVNDVQFSVGDEAAAFIQVILTATERVSLRTIQTEVKKQFGLELSHPERTLRRLPQEICAAIDVNKKGHQIKKEYKG